MQKLGFVARNNSTFILTLDFSQVAAIYPGVSGWPVRMQIKNFPTDTSALYEWVTAGAAGTFTYNSTANTGTFAAPQSGVASFSGVKYFDLRVEAPTGEFAVAYGEIDFEQGIALSGSGPNSGMGAGLGDTVFCVFSQALSSPAVPPVNMGSVTLILNSMAAYLANCNTEALSAAASLAAIGPAQTAAVAAVQAAQTTAVAALVAAAVTYQNFTQANFITWLNGLPTSLPGTAGQWWLDSSSGGVVLARS